MRILCHSQCRASEVGGAMLEALIRYPLVQSPSTPFSGGEQVNSYFNVHAHGLVLAFKLEIVFTVQYIPLLILYLGYSLHPNVLPRTTRHTCCRGNHVRSLGCCMIRRLISMHADLLVHYVPSMELTNEHMELMANLSIKSFEDGILLHLSRALIMDLGILETIMLFISSKKDS